MANAGLFYFYFTDWYWDEYILHTVILLGGCLVVWTWSGLEACLFWSCIDVIVVRVKPEELSHSPQLLSTVRTLVNRPMGRFEWTHSYISVPKEAARKLYGAFPDCGPLAADSATKLERVQLNVCTVYPMLYSYPPGCWNLCLWSAICQ